MDDKEIAYYSKGLGSRDLYESALYTVSLFTQHSREALDFGQSTTKVRAMRIRAEEWLSICDALRPQSFEGRNN